MNYIIFGGSGFIGTHLSKIIISNIMLSTDCLYILDLVKPRIDISNYKNVKYIQTDVRKIIEIPFDSTKDDIIFNFAAIHRTPGHPDNEYYETNILGAKNIVAFAEKNNILNVLFTSSIAVYGASEDKKYENTLLTPNTPYGISKVIAESVHEKWLLEDKDNRSLTIVRPGVVFGKGENGNFSRMIKALKGNYFFYPGRKDTIKACIYVKELINFFKYRMIDNTFKGCDIFNCTYEPAYTTEQIAETIKNVLNIKRRTYIFPAFLMISASVLLMPFLGKKIGIHPQRVKKLMKSTNISGLKLQGLAQEGYKMKYNFKDAITDLVTNNEK